MTKRGKEIVRMPGICFVIGHSSFVIDSSFEFIDEISG